MRKYVIQRTKIAAAMLSITALQACSADNYESMGEITATIDGRPYRAITLGKSSSHDASASYQVIGGMTMISMQGHDVDTGGIMDNVINVEVTLMGSNASASMMDAKVYYWPNGMGGPFYTSDQTGHEVSLTWEALLLNDDATARGSFETVLCRQEGFFDEVDTSTCIEISGRFDTGLVATQI